MIDMASSNLIVWARDNAAAVAALAGLGVLVWIVIRSPSKIAEDVGRGIVGVGRGAVTGAVDEFGKIVGAPSVYDVTDDPYVVRYMIDHPRGGYLRASAYATPVAMARALMLDEFSGALPPAGSRILIEFPPTGFAGAIP